MHLYRTALLLMAGCIAAIPAQAQSYLSPNPPRYAIEDRFRLEVDILYGSYDTVIRLDDTSGSSTAIGQVASITPGTTVSAEDDLGLPSTQVLGQVELTLLPGKHHMVRLNGLSMRRSASHVITHDIAWSNEDFHAGERVDSFLNYESVGLSYGYLPLRTDRYELGVSFGVQVVSVSMNARVLSGPSAIREADSGIAPLPLFGLEGRYEIARHWSVDARWQYLSAAWVESFGADLKGKEGTVTDGRIAVRWRQNAHIVYGLGYRFFGLEFSSPQTDPAGAVTMNMTGPMLFLQGSL